MSQSNPLPNLFDNIKIQLKFNLKKRKLMNDQISVSKLVKIQTSFISENVPHTSTSDELISFQKQEEINANFESSNNLRSSKTKRQDNYVNKEYTSRTTSTQNPVQAMQTKEASNLDKQIIERLSSEKSNDNTTFTQITHDSQQKVEENKKGTNQQEENFNK